MAIGTASSKSIPIALFEYEGNQTLRFQHLLPVVQQPSLSVSISLSLHVSIGLSNGGRVRATVFSTLRVDLDFTVGGCRD